MSPVESKAGCTSIAIALIARIPRLGSGADQARPWSACEFVLQLALEISSGTAASFCQLAKGRDSNEQ
jgi:hypothetical protein